MQDTDINDHLRPLIDSDLASARDYVFQGVSICSRRGWNYIVEYNRWFNDKN
ncbi:hypothetical protein [Desulfotruncus alcoholivorax]|uniref:hypothetical protein n=1 Tax=Desulfotruncus alcoholivorax TaxID=265477 RepID=UPI00042391BD|nr:hypothetical protein [Desulfotruncus alcoholivorax]